MSDLADIVLTAFEYLSLRGDVPSYKDILDHISDAGVVNRRTGKPYSLSMIYKVIRGHSKLVHIKKQYIRDVSPYVVMDKRYPLLCAWLLRNIPGAKPAGEVTVTFARRRIFYGVLPIDCVYVARRVLWFRLEGQFVLCDFDPDLNSDFEFVEVGLYVSKHS